MRTSFRLTLIGAALATLTMCTNTTSQPLTVWTSEPQVADYFDWYNANVEGAPVEVRPIEPGTGHRRLRSAGGDSPDLVIDRHLLKGDSPTRYASLNEIVEGRENEFYRPLLAAGRADETYHLTPISFDVPAVMFADAWEPAQDERRSIDLDELREAADAFNETDDGRPVRMGYSPIWQESFVLSAINAFRARFRRGGNDMPLWSRESVDEAVAFMRSWSDEVNGGSDAETDFQSRYLVTPGNRSVQQGRTGFWHTTAAEFFSMPEREIATLDVRWLTRDGILDVNDHTLWAAIPAGSEQQGSARSLLGWLLNPGTQLQLIEASYGGREPSFGFAGGFSSIQYVNDRYLTETHPELTGRIPGESQLRRPVVEHALWPGLARQVVVPWVLTAVRDEQDMPLVDQIENWLMQQEM